MIDVMETAKKKVAFICVHNSCRSQVAEALGRLLAADVFESFSAGTAPGPRIDPDAVRLIKRLYGIDIEASQRPKPLCEIPPVETAVTMGCNVQCPILPCKLREDWGIDDPAGKGDAEYVRVIRETERKVAGLKERMRDG